MGGWKMWIGATKDGSPVIGARACALAVVTVRVWPSQFRHRVVGRRADGGVEILTPTAAAQRTDLLSCCRFPPADGARAR